MAWQILILLRTSVAYILLPIFFKKSADLPFKIKRQFWIYSASVLFSFIYILYAKEFFLTNDFALAVIIGLANSLAFYFNMKAVNISQSRTSVLAIFTDFFTILLAIIFLKEFEYFNITLIIGFLLIIVSSIIFVYNSKHQFKKTGLLLKSIFISSVIWGIIALCLKIFASGGISFAIFGLGWYFGSWIGAVLLLWLAASKSEKIYKFSLTEIIGSCNIGFLTWVSLLISYLILKNVPLSIYEPFVVIGQIVFPVIIGLFIFKEIKSVKTLDIIAFSLAVISGAIIAFSY